MAELKIFLARPLFRSCVLRIVGAAVILAVQLRIIGDRRGLAIMRPFVEWVARGYRVTFPAPRRRLCGLLRLVLACAILAALVSASALWWMFWGVL